MLGSRVAAMKKNYLTLVLILTALSAPALQSFAMVPPPESLKASKHNEKAQQHDPNSTVITSGTSDKLTIMPPWKPTRG